MIRVAALCAVVACRAAAPVARSPAHRVEDVPLRDELEPRVATAAPSGGSIDVLAATADGAAAITGDAVGGVRLWPALDGSREPMIVDLPPTNALALVARDDGFTAAAIDRVGGLLIAQLDRDGRTRARGHVDARPAFGGVAATDGAFVTWRNDSSIVRYDDAGRVTGTVWTAPGELVVAVAVSGRHAVVTIDGAGRRRARSLELGDKLVWGPAMTLGEHDTAIAISPSGQRIAITRSDAHGAANAIIAELATGHELERWPTVVAVVAGFVDDAHLVLHEGIDVRWLALGRGSAARDRVVATTANRARPALAVGGGRAIAGTNAELVIATETDTQYLGYALAEPALAIAAPGGRVLVGFGATLELLDEGLASVATPRLTTAEATIVDTIALGGDDWLVESARGGAVTLEIADTARGTFTPVGGMRAVAGQLRYEPSTRLLTVSRGEDAEVLRYDPHRHALDRVAMLARAAGGDYEELVPVAPARADGVELVRVTVRPSGHVELRWLHDARALDQAAARIELTGLRAAVDSTGRVYAWHAVDGHAVLTAYRHGAEIAILPADERPPLVPAPDGTRVLELLVDSVMLAGPRGERLWRAPIQDATKAVWLGDDAIAVISIGGIARIDAATGEVTATRCGWKLALSATPHPIIPRAESVCARFR